jgi:hypothetical protein
VTKKHERLVMLPTVTATDWKGGPTLDALKRRLRESPRGQILRYILPHIDEDRGSHVNPTWGEWFMGWPMGWTDPTVVPNLEIWRKAVLDRTYWTGFYEQFALPRTVRGKGFPHLKGRLECVGNGQVPIVAATAFQILQTWVEGLP